MQANDRQDRIVTLVDEKGFLSVSELSELLQVSEMTIRRDLGQLDQQKRLLRTYGGAASLRPQASANGRDDSQLDNKAEGRLLDRVDVLVSTSINPNYDGLLLEQAGKKKIPIIAESLMMQNAETVVAIDNYQAGLDLGHWAARYAREHWNGQAYVLDLSYYLSNTQLRSSGFITGLRELIPEAEIVLSLNAQSRSDIAYQLTRDALTVHPNINIIFAINDSIAWGAIKACQEFNIDPANLMVIPFGLEGDTLKNAMMAGSYCKVGLAMFPEIVGPACIQAAIDAYNQQPLPRQLLTPYAVLTPETLPELYTQTGSSWKICWEVVLSQLAIPIDITPKAPRSRGSLPTRIGFIVPFSEHEWYRNLIMAMQEYAEEYQVEFEVVDANKNLEDEVDLRRRKIARAAAEQIQPGDVVLIDGGPIANYLAEMLADKEDITVITNAMPVFDILRQNPAITLITTGGAYRRSSQMLVGPTAEGALRELRADKLFMMVAGISPTFGLSHTNLSEVTMKQAMIRSAREVILLADHTFFGQESVVQVAPLTAINRLITDDALPASTRLDLRKLGIQIILAN